MDEPRDVSRDGSSMRCTLTNIASNSPGVLLSAATRLLDARNDFEEQRICIEMSYGIVQLYAKCIEVRCSLRPEHRSVQTYTVVERGREQLGHRVR